MVSRANKVHIETGGGSIQDTILLSDNSRITKVNGDDKAASGILREAAEELDALLVKVAGEPIEGELPSKAEVGSKAVRVLKKDKALKTKIISAIKVGSVEALKQLLQHPAATFFIAALDEWLKEEKSAAD